MTSNLESEFHQAMLNIYAEAAKLGYHATYFLRMVRQYGGLNTAKKLIRESTIQYGMTRLWELGRLDLSVEAHVVRERWAPLFTDAERRKARERLLEYGYDPS